MCAIHAGLDITEFLVVPRHVLVYGGRFTKLAFTFEIKRQVIHSLQHLFVYRAALAELLESHIELPLALECNA